MTTMVPLPRGSGKGRGGGRTHPLWLQSTEVPLSLSGLTSWTLHTLMYKYLPLAKVQAALCGCQTQQKTNIQGKVFTAVVAKRATANKKWPVIGRACLWCYHNAPGHWPLRVPTLLVMVKFLKCTALPQFTPDQKTHWWFHMCSSRARVGVIQTTLPVHHHHCPTSVCSLEPPGSSLDSPATLPPSQV